MLYGNTIMNNLIDNSNLDDTYDLKIINRISWSMSIHEIIETRKIFFYQY